jgi:hypothetical protein
MLQALVPGCDKVSQVTTSVMVGLTASLRHLLNHESSTNLEKGKSVLFRLLERPSFWMRSSTTCSPCRTKLRYTTN